MGAIRWVPSKEVPDRQGPMNLSVLIETMRREGYELCVSQPRVITRTGPKGERLEPYEDVVIVLEEAYAGAVIEELGRRLGQMTHMKPSGLGRVRFEYRMPSRGLIGYRSTFMTDARGTGVIYTHHRRYPTDHLAAYGREPLAPAARIGGEYDPP